MVVLIALLCFASRRWVIVVAVYCVILIMRYIAINFIVLSFIRNNIMPTATTRYIQEFILRKNAAPRG